MSDEFILADRIAAESVAVADLALCHVRLMNDRRYPWLLLLPRRPGLEEWTALPGDDLAQLSLEIGRAGTVLREVVPFDKLNVAALGNIVRQMHVHVIGRRVGDASWPNAVWGVGSREPYQSDDLDGLAGRLAAGLLPVGKGPAP